MALPLEQLLTPIAENPPCGDNKFDDLAYGSILDGDLEDIIGGDDASAVEGQRADSGDGDWPSFLGKIIGYMGMTKHLQLGYYATLADTNLSGLSGLSDGLVLLQQLLTRYWEELHPVIEDGDAEERLFILQLLNSSDLLNSISSIEVASGRQVGRFTLREALAAEDTGVPEPALVEVAINETLTESPDYYEGMSLQLAEIQSAAANLKEIVEEHLPGAEFSLAAFEERLGFLSKFLSGVGSAGVPVGELGEGEEADGGAGGSASGSSASGEIHSRADVARAIDRIIRFYSRHEPASPVPQLLARAKRIVDMNFMQIVDELALDRQTFNAEQIFGEFPQDQSSE